MPSSREVPLFDASEDEDSTSVISVRSIEQTPPREPKDRHLLVRVANGGVGEVFRIGESPCAIGRSSDCALQIADDGVSRRHAVFRIEQGACVLEDSQSANGTLVGGRRIVRQRLSDGDLVQLGPTATFRYTITDAMHEALLRELFESSVRDSLTGAHNRQYFDSQLRTELSYARRHHTDLSILLFDVDHFKRVNDEHGHPVGDTVLVSIANAVKTIKRGEDLFARYGGEEFAVVLRGIGIQGAARLGERLRRTVEGLTLGSPERPLQVTISVGGCSVREVEQPSPDAMLNLADHRLYVAKRSGRNRVVCSD